MYKLTVHTAIPFFSLPLSLCAGLDTLTNPEPRCKEELDWAFVEAWFRLLCRLRCFLTLHILYVFTIIISILTHLNINVAFTSS